MLGRLTFGYIQRFFNDGSLKKGALSGPLQQTK